MTIKKILLLGGLLSLIGMIAFGFQNCSEAKFTPVTYETPLGSMTVDPDNLEITPSGCTDEITPTCNGGFDYVLKAWGTNGILVGANSDNGAFNTNLIRSRDPNSEAAAYCANMVYGGFDDWYLPSRRELEAMFERRTDFGRLGPDFYWSSTEVTKDYPYTQTLIVFQNGQASSSETVFKVTHLHVRCIRKLTLTN
jgi:Protein of unknown function (DUF1566)